MDATGISQVGQRRHTWLLASPYAGPLAAVLLALPALWPLFKAGFFVSDDGSFHVYRIAALAQAWQQGVLHPRLFPEFGFGYGQAVLNFYAPLSYWPGAALSLLGRNPATAAQATIALATLLAALAAYGYARYLWGPAGGVLAALAYTYFPYHLADAYLRGAIPEYFAFVWPPLILWAYTAAFREDRPAAPLLWGTLAWAGLVYTHNLTAILMAMAAIMYLPVMALWTGRWRRLLPAAGSLLLAIALSAALWLPFLAESGTVGIGLGPSDGYREHLAPLAQAVLLSPFYRYRLQHGGAADHPLSWLAPALFVLAAGLVGRRLWRRRTIPGGPALGFGLLLALASAAMITAPSLPVWLPLAPVLAQLQYPWRFLALTAVGFLGIGGALPALLLREAGAGRTGPAAYGRWAVLALIALAVMAVPLPNLPAEPLPFPAADAWAPDRMWREDAEAGQVGATWTAEFLPLTVSEQRWALGRPREGAVDGPALVPVPSVALTRLGYQSLSLHVQDAGAFSLRLHQFHLSGWVATIDGQPAATYASGELGLVTVDVPAGSHDVSLRFGPTPARTAGTLLASAGALAWVAVAWLKRRAGRGLALAGVILLALTVALDLNSLGLGQHTWAPRPATSRLEDTALLLGYDAAPAQAAHAVDVTLYWLALRDAGTDYKAFVHLLDGAGQVVAQHDGDPGGGYTPTSRWRAGEIIADRHRLALPDGMAPGDYRLKAGLYQFEPLRNLSTDPTTPDGRIDLGTLRLLPGGQIR